MQTAGRATGRSGWLGQSLDGKRVLTVDDGKRTWSWDRPVEVRSVLAIARVEAMASERQAQAQRLEGSHLPTAVSAYQQLAKRYAGTAAGDAAAEHLRSKELKQAMAQWKLLARMRELAAGLQDAGGKTIVDADFARANARPLKELRAIARHVMKDAPDSSAATEATATLERYGIPLE